MEFVTQQFDNLTNDNNLTIISTGKCHTQVAYGALFSTVDIVTVLVGVPVNHKASVYLHYSKENIGHPQFKSFHLPRNAILSVFHRLPLIFPLI